MDLPSPPVSSPRNLSSTRPGLASTASERRQNSKVPIPTCGVSPIGAVNIGADESQVHRANRRSGLLPHKRAENVDPERQHHGVEEERQGGVNCHQIPKPRMSYIEVRDLEGRPNTNGYINEITVGTGRITG